MTVKHGDEEIASISLTRKQLKFLQSIIGDTEDRGPAGDGWQSDELQDLCRIIDEQVVSLSK